MMAWHVTRLSFRLQGYESGLTPLHIICRNREATKEVVQCVYDFDKNMAAEKDRVRVLYCRAREHTGLAMCDDPHARFPQNGFTPLDYRYPCDDLEELFKIFGSSPSHVNRSCSDDTMSSEMATWLFKALLKQNGAFLKLGVRCRANPNYAHAHLSTNARAFTRPAGTSCCTTCARRTRPRRRFSI